MESQNRKILCSTGKTHEQEIKTGKFFVQPKKHMNRDLKPENGIPKPEKPMNHNFSVRLNFPVTHNNSPFEPPNFSAAEWMS